MKNKIKTQIIMKMYRNIKKLNCILLVITLIGIAVSCSNDDDKEIGIRATDLIGVYDALTVTTTLSRNGVEEFPTTTDYSNTDLVREFTFFENKDLRSSTLRLDNNIEGFCWTWEINDGVLSLEDGETLDGKTNETKMLFFEPDGVIEIEQTITFVRENGDVDIFVLTMKMEKIEEATIQSSSC